MLRGVRVDDFSMYEVAVETFGVENRQVQIGHVAGRATGNGGSNTAMDTVLQPIRLTVPQGDRRRG